MNCRKCKMEMTEKTKIKYRGQADPIEEGQELFYCENDECENKGMVFADV